MTPILSQPTQRLTVYIGESDRWRGKALYAAILERLHAHGIAGATVLRGVAGYGAHSRIHTAAIVRLSEDLPLRIEVVDGVENIQRALQLLRPMVREGLITLEDVQVIRYTHRELNPLPADRPVREVMTPHVVSVGPETRLHAAWERMVQAGVKALPVVDDRGRVLGVLTGDDLFRPLDGAPRLSWAEHLDDALLNEHLRALADASLTVAQVMSAPAVVVSQDAPLGEAVALLVDEDIKRLPVVDADGRLVGVLSRVDILRQALPDATAAPAAAAGIPAQGAATLEDVMRTPVPLIPADADLPDVVAALLGFGEHRLVVVDSEGQVVGLISDVDLVARVRPQQRRSLLQALFRRNQPPDTGQTAADIMSPGALTGPAGEPLLSALARMLKTGRKWLVVTDTDGRPLGLVDRQQVLRALAVT